MSAEDSMDDGTPIKLSVIIDRSDGSAVFDFTGAVPGTPGKKRRTGAFIFKKNLAFHTASHVASSFWVNEAE